MRHYVINSAEDDIFDSINTREKICNSIEFINLYLDFASSAITYVYIIILITEMYFHNKRPPIRDLQNTESKNFSKMSPVFAFLS